MTLDLIVFQGAPHGGLGAPGSNAAGPKPQLLAGCSEVSHSFLTAKSWGFPAARPDGRTQDCEGGLVPARFRFLDRLSDLYGYMVVLALPRVQGIHRPRPDPNRSCLQIVQRFLTAFSQPSLGDFQPPLRTFRPRRLIRPKPSDFAIRTPVRGMFHLVCNSDDGCDSRRCWCAPPRRSGCPVGHVKIEMFVFFRTCGRLPGCGRMTKGVVRSMAVQRVSSGGDLRDCVSNPRSQNN